MASAGGSKLIIAYRSGWRTRYVRRSRSFAVSGEVQLSGGIPHVTMWAMPANEPGGQRPDSAMRLSLPPVNSPGMRERVVAPFSPLLATTAVQPLPAGRLVMAMGAGTDELSRLRPEATIIDPDPLDLLALAVQSASLETGTIARALTQLLDAPHRGRPWGQHLRRAYDTSCPACGRITEALSYRWQGSPPALVSRELDCEHCGFSGESAAEPEDRLQAAEIEPGKSLYWEMMGRVVEESDSLRPRLEQAVAFYTSRALWGLWQSLRILQDLRLSQDERRALQLILVEALWHGSSLEGQGDLLWQPNLRRPRRFVERNLWRVLDEAARRVARLVATAAAAAPPAQLIQRWPDDARRRLEPGSTALALALVPPSLPLYWLLRFVWSGWLFGRQAVAPLVDLLSLRSGEWELLRLRLESAHQAMYDWLAEGGELAVQWRWRGDEDPTLSILSSLPAAPAMVSVAALGSNEYVALAVSRKTAAVSPAVSSGDHMKVGADMMLEAVIQRGEPLTAPQLRPLIAAAWRRLGELPDVAEVDLETLLDPLAPPPGLQVTGNEGAAWEPGDPAWWWLHHPPATWQPATDQAERLTLTVLEDGEVASTDDLAWRISRDLPPACAPDRPWIEALAASYTEMTEDGLLLLPQDRPPKRQTELAALAQDLLAAGRRLGFDAAIWPEDGLWQVEWQRQARRRASFVLTVSTALTPRVWQSRAPLPGLSRFLVLPGSRASLVQWRIDHQPLWAAAALAGGWTFTKFRHLREMLADTSEEPERWLAHLHLDPITSGQAEQMSLFA